MHLQGLCVQTFTAKMALPFWLKSFCHVSEKIWKFFFLPPRFVLSPCLVHQWASIASFLRRLRGRCLWRHQQLWLRAAWTLFTMWKPSWRKTMFLLGLWTPRIGRWLPRWWKIPTMLPHTFCRASMLWILRVQLPTCRTLSTRWLKPWKRWSWGRLPMALKPPPGRRAWLPLRRSPLGMRHLWMTRWWSRPHTNGRSLAEVHLPLHSSWQMFPSSMRRWPWTSSRWWTSSAPRRSMTCLSSSATRRSSQLWALDVWSRPMWRWRPRRSMMRSWSNHMFQAAPVQGWAVIPCGRTPNLILLQHINAQNALRIGPPNGIPPRRGCASVGRRCCQSRRPSTWWTWTTPAATGCSSWLGMASHGCEMGSPRRMQRLPTAMSHPNRTRISNWGMRWILECWQKPHCAQLIMPRPACRIFCRARTGCNFALRYSTESLMLRPSHPKLRPGLRSPRTARRNRQLWCSTLMLLQPWPWPASWLGQMSHQKKLSIRRDQRLRCWRWCRIMPISCMTCRVALCQWRIRRGRRHCGIWIWSSLRRFWRGSSWRVQGPIRMPGKRWTAARWTLTQPRPKTGSMRKPGGLTSSSWHHHLGTHPSGERISNNWLRLDSFAHWLAFGNPARSWIGPMPLGNTSRRSTWLQSFDNRPILASSWLRSPRLEPGSPEAKVALLHHMINMCDGEIRLHAGRWRRYESTEVPTWAKLPQPTWEDAQALERRTHPRDQGSNFVEFYMYTDEELEDHRRLELRPYWSFLKGSFFAYEPAPADGGVGICWEKEVQTWTLPTLLGIYGHQFSLKQLWYAWENLPIAVKRHSRGQRGGGAQGAQDRIVERKKIQKETMDFLEQMQLPKPTSVEEWRLIWREVGTLLAAKHFISHTPVPVMDLPVADVVDSKEQLRFRAMCDERISFPFEELRPFEEVYAKLEPYVQSSSYVEVKVAWRCNTEQWWWAEVDPAHAGPLYRKLNYSDEAIRAFGLDPDLPVGAPALGAAAVGADSSTRTPLLMEYPDQPRPDITVENVNSVMGKDSKKKVGGKDKHIFWAKTECGLVLSSVTPWEIISKEKGVTTGGYMCKHCQGFWKQGRGATRLVQIIGRNRGKKVSLQLIMDEPPEALYNQWIRDRIEYYKRVEPVAPPRDEQLDLGPPVARLRVSHSNDRGAVGQMIWASILSNRELSNLQYIGKVADKHAKRARSSGDATIAWGFPLWPATADGVAGDQLAFPFSSLCFGWMCEGFSTAYGVVVPPHNDEDHEWQWSFMIFPLGIDPSSACHCKKCWSDFTMAARIPWEIVSFLMPFCIAFVAACFVFQGCWFFLRIWIVETLWLEVFGRVMFDVVLAWAGWVWLLAC